MKRLLASISILILLIGILFFSYFNNTSLANKQTVGYYNELKRALRQKGYSDNLIVISTRRFKWHNDIQVIISGAATKSRHLQGDAMDFLVFDINSDGNVNAEDVDIVYEILDKEIIKDKGGIGTYKNQNILSRQMVHIDCRDVRARWNR